MSKIVVIGGSGYIGGRLVGRLLRDGHSVRCLVRDPRKLFGRDWPGVEILKGNILDRNSIIEALAGCDVLYYLVHSISSGVEQYEELDQKGACIVRDIAALSGVKRIIYLGSLGNRNSNLPAYHRSRNEVGNILESGPVPVTQFRAAMIVGSGSASFDMMYSLVNVFPLIIAPRFIETISQPISTRDTIRYLAGCLNIPESIGKVIDIGGPEILSYRNMMLRLAKQLNLKRKIMVVPNITPSWFSSFWINLATPIPTSLARMLIDGLQCEMVVENDLASKLFSLKLMGFDESVTRALNRMREGQVETKWSNASFAPEPDQDGYNRSVFLKDVRQLEVKAHPDQIYKVFASIGGERGWYFGNILWKIRGFGDKMIGGVGLRRGRRHPEELIPGDALDFWRVETVEIGRRVVLRAEMKAPGMAWLEFLVVPIDDSKTLFTQTASFYPKGIAGFTYWYALSPFHAIIFTRMAREIARRAGHESLNQ